MNHKFDKLFYFLTLWFSASVIVLLIIGMVFKLITHLNK